MSARVVRIGTSYWFDPCDGSGISTNVTTDVAELIAEARATDKPKLTRPAETIIAIGVATMFTLIGLAALIWVLR